MYTEYKSNNKVADKSRLCLNPDVGTVFLHNTFLRIFMILHKEMNRVSQLQNSVIKSPVMLTG